MADDSGIITVTGATGRQGGAVVRQLLADGWTVRAVTRNGQSKAAQQLAGLGASVVTADMADGAALAAAFADSYGVYSVQNPMISGVEAEVVQGRAVGEAAYHAGVRHLVYGSAGVADSPTGVGSWDSKLTVQAHLEGLGLPLTVLRPMAFMELMTDKTYFPPVSTWHVMPRLMGDDRPVGWLCVEDLGAVAAKAFADTERFAGRNLGLAADIKSIAECRHIWTEVRRRPPRRFPMPVPMFERFVGSDLTTMWRWLSSNEFDLDTTATRDLLPAAMTVRQWLEHGSR